MRYRGSTRITHTHHAYASPIHITHAHHAYASRLRITHTHHACASPIHITHAHHPYTSRLRITHTHHACASPIHITHAHCMNTRYRFGNLVMWKRGSRRGSATRSTKDLVNKTLSGETRIIRLHEGGCEEAKQL
ncbi:hypothetical protein Vafri_5150 [Volvox africanus]|uniref:Uncharacterized protein n=1 Tax=Volvox africanus TaxID=51714 RepID=A0A8J4AVF9_9CHLO|nr:hypothetical protein Vafri_5150 [Volvox africanus]